MPPDLVVDKTVLPSPVAAPCPQQVQVVVRNAGSADASYPFSVGLYWDTNGEPSHAPQRVCPVNRPAEGAVFKPGDTVTCSFDVAFPCRPQNFVRAVADVFHQVTGNLRSNADVTQSVPVVLAPWLLTNLRVGFQDSSGAITWDPAMLCANLPLLAHVEVSNRGCADAPASTTGLTITGPSGQLTSVQWSTTKLTPGQAASFFLHPPFKFPSPPPASVTVQACADIWGVVAGQCDTSGLCASKALVVSPSAGSPALALTVDGGAVKPGEVPFVSWQLANDCSDLGGAVTAAVFFGSDQLYATSAPIPVGPLGSVGEVHKQLTVPASAAAKLFVVGQHTLELRVTSSTTPAKTFKATALLTVELESLGSTFLWTQPAVTMSSTGVFTGAATWHKVYDVAGVLTNMSAFSSLTVAGITITEATTTPGISAAGAMPVGAPGPLAPGAATTLAVSRLFKTWTWINPTTFALSGPTSVPFTYLAAATLTDEFGNVYPPLTSPTLTVTVAVSAAKLALQAQAAAELKAAAAALAAAAGSLNPLAAVVGFALWGLAIWHKGQADDPPVPDFGYDERVRVEPAVHELRREDAPPWAPPMAAVLNLLERARAAQEALARIHAKILGARVDGAAEALRLQADDYRAALARLQAAAAELGNAAALAAEQLATDERMAAERLAADLEALRSGATLDAARQAWRDNRLPEEAFEDLHRRIVQLADVAPLGSTLPVIVQHTIELAQALTDESTGVLALADGI
jgi:hypothetical protein